MTEIIITGVIGLITTIVSSVVTWLVSRKKYNAGVDHDRIANMEQSLKFYETLTESNNKTLQDLLEKSEQLATSNINLLIEVQNLRVQVEILSKVIRTELKGVNLSKYGINLDEKGNIIRTKQSKPKKHKDYNNESKAKEDV